jgi:hypothetical protein
MDNTDDFRSKLGSRLVFGSTIALTGLGLVIMVGAAWSAIASNKPETLMSAAQLLLSALLPLFGTWVGTILAFYYTKESYQAASQGTLEAVKSATQRLSTTPVATKMMPLGQIINVQIPAGGSVDQLSISDIEKKFDTVGANGQRISRLLILDSTGVCIGILHHSLFAEMLAMLLRDNPQIDLTATTFASLLQKESRAYKGLTYRDLIQRTIAFVAQDRTVADAKAAMEQIQGCQDVIVTKTGDRTEPIIGWLSNIDVTRLSTV